MSDLLPLIIVGLTTGSVYALAAMGLVLTYKTSGLFNFAHGAQAALAAYLMFTLHITQGLPWPLAALVAVLLAGVLGGLLLERLAQALAGATTSARVVATVGLLVGTQGTLTWIYGSAAISFEQFLPDHVLHLPGVNVRMSQVITAVVALLAAAGLFVFFRRSRLGVAMVGVVDDPDLLALAAINPSAVRRTAWLIGSVFASVSGLLLAPAVGLDATLLTLLVVQAFGAAAIGAFNNLLPTYFGGLAIGVAVATLQGRAGPLAELAGQSTLPFLVLVVVLLVAPTRTLVQRGTAAVVRERPLAPLPRAFTLSGIWVGGALLLAVPAFAGVRIGYFTQGLAYVILFASLGLLVRTSDQVSLAHIAFAAVGAATSAHVGHTGAPWLVALLVGGLAAVPVGALVAVPAIRLSGVYLAIATFGFGVLVQTILYRKPIMFGSQGLLVASRPQLGSSDTGYYYVALIVAVACLALVMAVRRSRLGFLLRGLADSPLALEAHGTDTRLTRLYVFCVSAFLAGVAGGLIGPITGSTTADSFGFSISLSLVAVLAIAGRRPLLSPFLAALFLAVLPRLVDSETLTSALPVIFGSAAMFSAVISVRPVAFTVSRRTRERPGLGPSWRRIALVEGAR